MRFSLGFSAALALVLGFFFLFPADLGERCAVSCIGCSSADKAWLRDFFGR